MTQDIFTEHQLTPYAEEFGKQIKGNEKAIEIVESVFNQVEKARQVIWDKYKDLTREQKDDYTKLVYTRQLLRETLEVAKSK